MTRPKNMNVVRLSDYGEHNDDFPTPPWATRAFFEFVAPDLLSNKKVTILDPCCGRGHMLRVFKELKFRSIGYDNRQYNSDHKLADYASDFEYPVHDYVVTNPPYKLANHFAQRALKEARLGVGLLLRTIWMESTTRHDQLFKPNPPTLVAVFSKRVPAAQGKIIKKGGAMMSHSWFWWDKTRPVKTTRLIWIPPDAQARLEKDSDYD